MQQPGYTLLLLFCGLAFSATTMAENNHEQHPQADADTAQHHHHHDSGELRLNQGKKWQTDKALRKGMRNIRSAAEAAVQSAHASPGHQLDKQQAEILADQVNQQVEHIFAECKLSAEADAVLHGLLADMLQAAQQLKGHRVPGSQSPEQARLQALLKLHKSLDTYPQYFDDSEWQAE